MINVNMVPNMDVPTLHCSQGDTKERKFEVALHNNGKLIDASDFQKPLIFDSFAGGTEEIIGENTAPIIADIDYPDETRNNQVFLYRQSPSAESGNAKITAIRGNTVKFNQLVKCERSEITVSDIVITKLDFGYNYNGQASAIVTRAFDDDVDRPNIINGHKYYIKGLSGGSTSTYCMYLFSTNITNPVIYSATSDINQADFGMKIYTGYQINLNVYPQIFDLTAMGIDNLTTVEQVETWLSNNIGLLPYYDYTPGTLIPFKGTGLKTTGKNLFDISSATQYRDVITNGTIAVSESARHYASDYIKVFPSSTYHISSMGNWTGIGIAFYDGDKNFLSFISGQIIVDNSNNFVSPQKAVYMRATVLDVDTAQIELGSTATDYEPYISSTLSLPISTYFPTGMKDVPDYTNGGTIYDELSSSRADTKVKSVDLGTLIWNKNTSYNTVRFIAYSILTDVKEPISNDYPTNCLCKYTNYAANVLISNGLDGISITLGGSVTIRDNALVNLTAEQFKSAMSGVILYYELATPIETELKTASLVCENGEAVAYPDEENLIIECNSEISSQSGIFPAKIKLQEGDDIAYSSLIKLIVEEKPNDNSIL